MFGFKSKKDKNSNMKEVANRMMSGNFDLNDLLTQLKQIRKMSSFSGILKILPGMSNAVNTMKEKIKDGSIDLQIKILEAMTEEERKNPDKIFANAKNRIAETASVSVREVESLIKQHIKMKQNMAMIEKMGGMEAIMNKMKKEN